MTEIRNVKHLEWARQCARPQCIPVGRPRGAKAQGLRYERLLASRLPLAKHGQWFEFTDGRLGHGYCQPDFLLMLPEVTVILECKYTWTVDGHLQIERLYKPVVAEALGKPAVGIVVCKRLEAEMRGVSIVGDLKMAISLAVAGHRPVFHWLGKATVSLPSPRYVEEAMCAA